MREILRLLNHCTDWHASRNSPPKRNYAEGAAVIAAVLDLQKSAGATFKAVDKLGGGFPDGKDVVDPQALGRANTEVRVALEFKFFFVAQHEVDIGHLDEGLWLDLRCTTGDNDFRTGVRAFLFANRLL